MIEGQKEDVQECVRCLYRSTHPFGLHFDSEGVCTGCLTHDEKFSLDWESRFSMLEAKVRSIGKKSKNAYYDCVIPVRGTPEHFYVVDVVKNRLGLNPLIVTYNSQFNSIVGIRNLDRIRENFDVDILNYATNPFVYKKLIRESLVRLTNMRWPYLAGETSFPVQVAVERSIPLIIWPWHQTTEQVGMHSYTETPEMTWRNRTEFDLMGWEPSRFVTAESMIRSEEIEDIEYPLNSDLFRSGVIGIYLGNYLPWDSRAYSEEMIRLYGALASKNPRTFDTYDRIDDMTYMTVHDVLKYSLHGYSRVTDNLCREIRFGRISKEDAKTIEAYFQAEYPKRGIKIFLDWLGMTEDAFSWMVDQTRFGFPPRDKMELSDSQMSFVKGFQVNSEDVMASEEYIIYGKGIAVSEQTIPPN